MGTTAYTAVPVTKGKVEESNYWAWSPAVGFAWRVAAAAVEGGEDRLAAGVHQNTINTDSPPQERIAGCGVWGTWEQKEEGGRGGHGSYSRHDLRSPARLAAVRLAVEFTAGFTVGVMDWLAEGFAVGFMVGFMVRLAAVRLQPSSSRWGSRSGSWVGWQRGSRSGLW